MPCWTNWAWPSGSQHNSIEALNKIDLLDAEERAALDQQAPPQWRRRRAVAVSAATGEGCDGLLALIDARLAGDRELVELEVPIERRRRVGVALCPWRGVTPG